MGWPTSQDYNEAIQNATSCFSDPDLKKGEVTLNAIGLPVPRSGNFADVYQFKGGDGKMWAIKCFTRKVSGLQERYAKIDEHLSKANFPFTVGFKYLAEGIRIRGEWHPLLKMEWVEGFTLNEFVRDNAGKPNYLHALMQMWGKLTALLRDANFAHADLQHGNVLLVPGTSGTKLGLKLIDYDGMWVPALAETHSGEVGHPNFQHPLRLKDRLYNADVDRFPHLVIATALRGTLIGGKPFWDKWDNGDNLLFKEADLRDPVNSPVVKALWDLNDDVLCTLVGKLALASREPLRKAPWLDDVLFEEDGPKLGAEEEKKVLQMLGVKPHFTAPKENVAAVKAVEEFSDFDVVDDDDERPMPRRPEKKKRKKQKEEEKAKSKLPYYIGGGVLALLLLVGGIIAATSGGNKTKPSDTEVAKNDDKRGTPRVEPKKDPQNDPKVIPEKKDLTKVDPTPKKVDPIPKKDPGIIAKKDPVDAGPLRLNEAWNVRSDLSGPVAFAGDGKLFTIQNNQRIVAFDVRDGAVKHNWGVGQSIARASIRADGSILAGYVLPPMNERKIMCWDPQTNQPRYNLDTNDITNPFFAFSDKAGIVFVPLKPGVGGLGVFSLADGKKVDHLAVAGQQFLFQVSCTEDGEAVLASTPPGTVFFRSAKNAPFRQIAELKGIAGNTPIPKLSPDGKHFVHFNGGETIFVYETATGKMACELKGHTGRIDHDQVYFSPDCRLLFSVGDNTIRIWDLASASEIKQIDIGETVGTRHLGISPDGQMLCLSSIAKMGGSSVRMWNITGAGEAAVIAKNNPEPKVEVKLQPPGPAPEIKEVWKNTENVHYMHFSRDGSKIVSVMSGTLLIHEASSGKLLHSTKFADAGTLVVTPLPDGNVLVRGPLMGGKSEMFCFDPKNEQRPFVMDDPALLMWNASVGKNDTILTPIRLGGIGVFSAKDGKRLPDIGTPGGFAPNQMHLATESEAMLIYHHPGRVFVRTAADQPFKKLDDIPQDGSNSPNVRMAPNGKRYLHHSSRGPITVYSVATGKPEAVFEGHADVTRRAVFTNDARFVLSVGWDKSCRIWEVASGKEVGRIPVIGNPGDVAVSPDGRFAITCSNASPNGHVMQMWSIGGDGGAPVIVKKDPVEIKNQPILEEVWKVGKSCSSTTFAFSADSDSLIVCPRNATVEKLKLTDGTVMSSFKPANRVVSSFKICPNDCILISETDKADRRVALWDLKTGQKKFDFAPLWSVPSAWADPVKNQLLNPIPNGEIEVYSLTDGKKQNETIKVPLVGKDTPRIHYSRDGNTAAIMLRSVIHVRPAGEQDFKAIANNPTKGHSDFLVSPDGAYVAYRNNLEPIHVWDSKTQKLVCKLEGHTEPVDAFCFTADSKRLISASDDKTLRVWDVASGKQLQSIPLSGKGQGLVASRDGKYIASLTEADNVIQLWRIKDAAENPIVKKDPEPEPMPDLKVVAKNPYEGKEGLVKDSLPMTARVVSCFFSIDLARLYVATENGVVQVLDPMTLTESARFTALEGRVIQAMAVRKVPTTNPPKDLIYVLDDKKHVHVYDPEKKAVVKDLSLENQLNDPNDNIAFTMAASPDTKTLIICSRRGFNGVSWDLTRNQSGGLPQLAKPNFGNKTMVVTWSADGKYGAGATASNTLVWDAKTGRDIGTFKGWNTDHLAVNSEATTVVSASSQMFAAYNFTTGKEIWNVKPTSFFAGLQAIPKSNWIAYSGPSEIVIRDCKTGEEIAKWMTPENGARLLASRDGRFLVTWNGRENKVHLWSLPVPAKK